MKQLLYLLILVGLELGCQQSTETDPTVYIIGDSTVKNGRGDGAGGLWGWGDPIVQYFDTSRISLENHALGGTSSRSYRSMGLWDSVLVKLQPGDYVLMQFGHNDAGPLNDTLRARGTIKGTGDESEEIDNLLTGEHEVVHTYGWYMRQYIKEAREKGAIPVVMAPIPRNDWNDGNVPRNDESYGGWAKQVAEEENVCYIDLNEKMASAMEAMGEDSVTGTYFFKRDHTHTTAKGAVLAASKVVEGLKELQKCDLKDYLLENPKINFPVKKNVFVIGDSTVANGNDSIVGWGREIDGFFDTTRVNIINKARGGRSSRTFLFEGLWQEVLDSMKAGDFLLVQFGHNDGGYIDKPKFRGSLKGTGPDSVEIVRPDSTKEVVRTYGWYLSKYIQDAQAKNVCVIILSQIPRNRWEDGKVERVDDNYGKWAKLAAQQNGAHFLDLNNAVAEEYEEMGRDEVKKFFPGDHTHTNAAGAEYNAWNLAKLIRWEKPCRLHAYLDFSKL